MKQPAAIATVTLGAVTGGYGPGGYPFARSRFHHTPSWGPFGKSPYEGGYGTWKVLENGIRQWTPTIPFIWGK